MDAGHLVHVGIFQGEPVGAVVSGLPLLSMSPRKITAILAGAFTYMRPGGAFYQFTYGPRCPVPRPILDRMGLKATHIGGTMRNLPPAAVYKISRRKPLALSRERFKYRSREAEMETVAGETGGSCNRTQMAETKQTSTAEGRRERKRRQTRERIEQAAMTLFLERGFDATTIEEITDSANVSKRSFFDYFPSKEEVVFASAGFLCRPADGCHRRKAKERVAPEGR